MNPLKIGTDANTGRTFALPLDLVTQTIAILARKGKGKSYLADVFAEELLEAAEVPVIIDPTGAHWGLKSSADGAKAGYKIVVFGGDHADLPLEETAGEIIARAIVEHRFPAILDVSLLRKSASHRFLADFLGTLYRLNRHPVHLICDEADDYAPQRPFGDEARVLGAMEDIVRRGRIKGIGCTLVTQRPQVINKNVLTQAEMLVTLNMGHPKDIGAIQEWVAVHGDEEQAKAMIASLPALERGTAWFWAPGWGNLFAKVNVRTRRTFNSGATPKPGERIVAPKQLASVDVQTLGKEIAATAQRAKENAPETLRARIRELEKQLASKPQGERIVEKRVEVPVLSDADRELIGGGLASLAEFHAELKTRYQDILMGLAKFPGVKPSAPTRSAVVVNRAVSIHTRTFLPTVKAESNGHIGKAERSILTCLAQFGLSAKTKVAAVAGYSPSGGGFNNSLGALRSRGYITPGDPLDITPEGREALGDFTPLPTGRDLINYWMARLPKAERAILDYLAEAYPNAVEKEVLAVQCGYEPTGGGFNNALGALRTRELITRGNEIKANDNLFS